jgi:hypothetical protein
MEVLIQGKPARAVIDSGAEMSLISPRWVEKNHLPFMEKEKSEQIVLADGSPARFGNGWIHAETTEVKLQVRGIREIRRFDITDIGEHDLLLGWDWVYTHNPVINWQRQTIRARPTETTAALKAEQLWNSKIRGIGKISRRKALRMYRRDPSSVRVIWVRKVSTGKESRGDAADTSTRDSEDNTRPPEYHDFEPLFAEQERPLAQHQPWDHEIFLERNGIPPDHLLSPEQEMKAAKLKPLKMHPLSQEQEEEVRRHLKEYLRKGYIRPSKSPMASPILLVPKKNGKWRLCVDFRQLNNATIKNRYPLPLISELQDRVAGADWLTALISARDITAFASQAVTNGKRHFELTTDSMSS